MRFQLFDLFWEWGWLLNYLYQNLESMILQSIFSWKWFYWKIIRRSWFMEKFLYVTEYNETEKIIKKWLKYNYTMFQLTSLSKEDPSRPLCTLFCYYCWASDSRKRRVLVREQGSLEKVRIGTFLQKYLTAFASVRYIYIYTYVYITYIIYISYVIYIYMCIYIYIFFFCS